MQAWCGGCPLLPLARERELQAKVDLVVTHLSQRGIDPRVQLHPQRTSRFGYRNRLRMQVLEGRADFFNDAKANGCPIVRGDLWQAIEHLRLATQADSGLLANSRHLEVRVGDDGAAGVVVSHQTDLQALEAHLGTNWAVSYVGHLRPPTLRYRVAPGVEVPVPIGSFVQVNSEVNRQLVDAVLTIARSIGAATFVDLFSGAGNFTVPLAAQGLSGTAVDNAGAAIAELGRSEAATAGNIQCIEGDARSLASVLNSAELIVADPPRAGLQQNYRQLVELVDNTLVLIGCKATAFAADVAAICQEGMLLDSITVFDMFPGTKHVEAMAVLTRA